MFEAAIEDRWYHTAWLCHVIASANGMKKAKPEQFNALRLAETERKKKTMTTKEIFAQLKAEFHK